MGGQAQLEGLERFVFAVAAGSLVCTYHKGSQEQVAGVRAGSEKGVAYHIASSAPAGGNDGVVFLMKLKARFQRSRRRETGSIFFSKHTFSEPGDFPNPSFSQKGCRKGTRGTLLNHTFSVQFTRPISTVLK